MATTVLMARTLGAEDLGSYTFAISVISLVVVIAQLGFPELTVREVSLYLELGRRRLLARYLRHANATIIKLSFIVLFALAAYLLLYGSSIQAGWQAILAGLPLVVILPLMAQARGVLHGAGRVVQSVVGQQLYRPGVFLLLFIGFLALGLPISPISAMALQGLASLLVMFEMKYRAYRAIPKLGKPVSVPKRRLVLWSISALMFTGVAVVQFINTKFDIIALGILTDDTQVGLYAVSVQLSQAAAAMLLVTSVVATPGISRASAAGDDYLAEQICRQSALLSLATAFATLVGAFLIGEWFIASAFGQEYKLVWPALMVLLVGQTLAALFGPLGVLLNMRGQERSTLKFTAIASFINIMLNLVLIPRYGLTGAAFATAFSMLMWNLLMWFRAWSLWRINASAIPYSVQSATAQQVDANS